MKLNATKISAFVAALLAVLAAVKTAIDAFPVDRPLAPVEMPAVPSDAGVSK